MKYMIEPKWTQIYDRHEVYGIGNMMVGGVSQRHDGSWELFVDLPDNSHRSEVETIEDAKAAVEAAVKEVLGGKI